MPDIWVFPVASNSITQGSGPGHYAVDIGLVTGSPLYAPTRGVVQAVINSATGYGKHIILKAQDGSTIILAHLSSFNVQPGQKVNPGQVIGQTGSTGNSTGPHLHYEIRGPKGEKVDPLKIQYGAASTKRQASKPAQASTPAQAQTTTTTKRQALITTSVNMPGGTKPAEAKEKLQAAQTAGKLPETPGYIDKANSLIEGVNINWGNIAVTIIGLALITIGAVGLVKPMAEKAATTAATAAIKAAV